MADCAMEMTVTPLGLCAIASGCHIFRTAGDSDLDLAEI
jgi:hypothetical protein